MNYNLIPKNKNNCKFVDNKEIFNNRLFDRNALNRELSTQKNIVPRNMYENYNINRSETDSIFNRRIDCGNNKPIKDFISFQDNHINKVNIINKKEITNFNQISRNTSILNRDVYHKSDTNNYDNKSNNMMSNINNYDNNRSAINNYDNMNNNINRNKSNYDNMNSNINNYDNNSNTNNYDNMTSNTNNLNGNTNNYDNNYNNIDFSKSNLSFFIKHNK
jgi:hypothetical protein